MHNIMPHNYSQDVAGSTQAHWSGEAWECQAATVQMGALIKTVTLMEIVIPASLQRLGAGVGGRWWQCP